VIASQSLEVNYLTWYGEQGNTMSFEVDSFQVPPNDTINHRMSVFADFPPSWHADGMTYYDASDGTVICSAWDTGHGGI